MRGFTVFTSRSRRRPIEGSKPSPSRRWRRPGVPRRTPPPSTDFESALAFVKKYEPPVVIKADGLAAARA
jgi:phosphoribosylamine-glycine ligase